MKKNVSKNRQGKLIVNGVILEKHEMATVVFLLGLGKDITLIPPSTIPGRKTPDFSMKNLQWEMKSPKYGSRSTIEHAFQTAVKQSENVVFDLRRIKIQDLGAISVLEQRFLRSKRAKRMLIINKQGQILQYD